jgi:hypothetical protein
MSENQLKQELLNKFKIMGSSAGGGGGAGVAYNTNATQAANG